MFQCDAGIVPPISLYPNIARSLSGLFYKVYNNKTILASYTSHRSFSYASIHPIWLRINTPLTPIHRPGILFQSTHLFMSWKKLTLSNNLPLYSTSFAEKKPHTGRCGFNLEGLPDFLSVIISLKFCLFFLTLLLI